MRADLFFASVFSAATLVCVATPSCAELLTVQMRGSPLLLATAQRIAQRYMTQYATASVVIGGGGSHAAIKDLLDGSIDFAMFCGDLPDEVVREAERRQIALEHSYVLHLPVRIIVHRDNPVDDIPLRQLRNIYFGKTANWKTIGGNDLPIAAYLDPPSGELHTFWENAMAMPRAHFTPHLQVQNWATSSSVPVHGALIPLAGDETVQQGKAVRIDGIAPDLTALRNRSYPLLVRVSLEYRKPLSRAQEDFLNFFLDAVQSEPGQESP